jgi:hypothetical protein
MLATREGANDGGTMEVISCPRLIIYGWGTYCVPSLQSASIDQLNDHAVLTTIPRQLTFCVRNMMPGEWKCLQ